MGAFVVGGDHQTAAASRRTLRRRQRRCTLVVGGRRSAVGFMVVVDLSSRVFLRCMITLPALTPELKQRAHFSRIAASLLPTTSHAGASADRYALWQCFDCAETWQTLLPRWRHERHPDMSSPDPWPSTGDPCRSAFQSRPTWVTSDSPRLDSPIMSLWRRAQCPDLDRQAHRRCRRQPGNRAPR